MVLRGSKEEDTELRAMLKQLLPPGIINVFVLQIYDLIGF